MLLGMLAALGQGHMYYMRSRSNHIWGLCMPFLVFAAVIRNKTTEDIQVILMSFSMARQIVSCQNLDDLQTSLGDGDVRKFGFVSFSYLSCENG